MAIAAGNYKQLWELIKDKRYVKTRTLTRDAHNVKRGVINKKHSDVGHKMLASTVRYQLRTKLTPEPNGNYTVIEFWLDEYPVKRMERGLLI